MWFFGPPIRAALIPGWTTGALAVGTVMTIRWLLTRSGGIQSARVMLSPKLLNQRPSLGVAILDLDQEIKKSVMGDDPIA